jgi:hypothetical protein
MARIGETFNDNVFVSKNEQGFKLTNSGSLELMSLYGDGKTTRGLSADLIIVDDFDVLNKKLLFNLITSLLVLKQVKCLFFYKNKSEVWSQFENLLGFHAFEL